MPEGPECTIVAKQLHSFCANKELTNIELLTGRYTKKAPDGYNAFLDILPQTVAGVNNKGKFIYLMTDHSDTIFITLGMSGTFKTEDNKYARVKFCFSDGSEIFYSDMRNFGTLKFFTRDNAELALQKKLSEIGPDMLNDPCQSSEWLEISRRRNKNSMVKFLMNQKNISGVGNIYKSEALFLAGIDPRRTIESCSDDELMKLYEAVKKVLKSSYESGGSTIRNYSDLYNNHGKYTRFPSNPKEMLEARWDNRVMIYGRKTDIYGNPVAKIKLDDGRTTYYSPEVQK
jgi:formamidopyrimidine-DNA glycosylase